jgi:RHS repeat-associated protein
MIFDKTGSLAGTKRHDYLPFGEEIGSGTGLRSTALGYSGDTTRQKFTGYERDVETGLDYAQARYYANAQGRFASVDPLGASASTGNPQSWNRYAYVLNNPLVLTDPSGMSPEQIDNSFRNKELGIYGELEFARHANYDNMKTTTQLGREFMAAFTAWAQMFSAAYQQSQAQNSQRRILIIVGEPGTGRHYSAGVFELAAATKRRQFEAAGDEVIVVDAHNSEGFQEAFNNNGMLDGVEFIGHASHDWLGVGNAHEDAANFRVDDVKSLSKSVLRAGAYVKLNSCFAGSGGYRSIAGALANHLDRNVWAMSSGTVYSSTERYLTPLTGSSQSAYVIEDRTMGTRLVCYGYGCPH